MAEENKDLIESADPTTTDDLYQSIDELVTAIMELEDTISRRGGSVGGAILAGAVGQAGSPPVALRVPAGPGGSDQPPAGGADRPHPVYGTEPVGGHGAEQVRVLLDIRDAVRLILRRSAGRGADGPHPEGRDQGGWLDRVMRPVMDRLRGTKVGRAVDRAISKVPEPVRRAVGEAKDRAVRAVGRRLARGAVRTVRTPPKGGATPAQPVRGSVPASGAARAGAGESAAGGAARAGAAGAGAGGGAMAAAGPVAVILLAAAALFEVGKAGKRLAYQQEEHARMLSDISPEIASVMAQLDASRTFRKMDKGAETAATAGANTRAIDRFEKATQRWEVLADNVQNTVGAVAMNALSEIVESVNKMTDGIEKMVQALPGMKDFKFPKPDSTASETLGDFMMEVYQDGERREREAQARIDAARKADRGR